MNENITTVIMQNDGKLSKVLPNGSYEQVSDKSNIGMLKTIKHDDIEVAAASDPDNLPLNSEDIKNLKPLSRVKIIRGAMKMTQEEFAAKFHLSLSALRDWEQGRYQPDQAARSYLKVIAANSQMVLKALNTKN